MKQFIKIKEIATSIGLVETVMTDDTNCDVLCYLNSDGAVPTVDHITKFAVLIVRECAKIADSPSAWQPGYNIKNKFEVM